MESTNEKIVETLQEVVTRIAALETAVAGLTDKRSPQTEGIRFEHLGGRKVGHPVPARSEKEIDFSAIGGKCVRRAKDHRAFKAKPDEPEPDESSTGEVSQ
jgi:hypothetical protein